MRTVVARELLAYEPSEVWAIIGSGRINLVLDDGVLPTTCRRAIFSSYIWDIHRRYPKTPLLINHVLTVTDITSTTHCELLKHAVYDCRVEYGFVDPAALETLQRLIYQIFNNLYNDGVLKLGEYVTSCNLLDLLEVVKHPEIAEANRVVFEAERPTFSQVSHAHEVAKRVINKDSALKYNAVSRWSRHGLVKWGAIVQSVSPRGFATDADSNIFPVPIRSGFVQGIYGLEDSMKESRSATMALVYQEGPMQDSEYLNRELQLSAASLSTLYPGDCGSRGYIPWTLSNLSHHRDIIGMAISTPDGEHVVTERDSHLVGTTVMMRSVSECLIPDRNGVCLRCFGEMGLNIPALTNLGHASVVEVQKSLTQETLSVKHVISSSEAASFVLTPFTQEFLTKVRESDDLFLSVRLKGKPLTLSFSEADGNNINDVLYVSNLKELAPPRITNIKQIHLGINHGDYIDSIPLVVSEQKRDSYLSMAMLEYVKENGWTVTNDDRYVIDMSLWDYSKPILQLPSRQYSTPDFMLEIKTFIQGRKPKKGDTTKTIIDHENFATALAAFHDLVNQRFNVNVSHLQAILLHTMVQSIERHDYRLPAPPRSAGQFSSYAANVANRSISARLAHEGQETTVFSINPYLYTDRPPHPLDELFVER